MPGFFVSYTGGGGGGGGRFVSVTQLGRVAAVTGVADCCAPRSAAHATEAAPGSLSILGKVVQMILLLLRERERGREGGGHPARLPQAQEWACGDPGLCGCLFTKSQSPDVLYRSNKKQLLLLMVITCLHIIRTSC